jgi:hypothetical protein
LTCDNPATFFLKYQRLLSVYERSSDLRRLSPGEREIAVYARYVPPLCGISLASRRERAS